MLLKEIFNQENLNKEEFFGITIDKESTDLKYSSSPPNNIKALGFVLFLDSDNSIDTDLIDIIINYKLTHITVILEVPSHLISNGYINAKELIQLSNNLDVALSILPPGHPLVDKSVSEDDYVKIISDLTDFIIEKPNFDKSVMPISNFMEYLMIEKILGENSNIIKNFKPQDDYIIDNFSSILTVEGSDSFKNVIRHKLYDLYGGKENFDVVAETILQSIQDRSEQLYKQLIEDSLKQQSQN